MPDEPLPNLQLSEAESEYLAGLSLRLKSEQARFEGIQQGVTMAVSAFLSQVLKERGAVGMYSPSADFKTLVPAGK